MDSYFVREFNSRKRDAIWKLRGKEIKIIFRENLEVLEFKDKRKHCEKSIKSFEQVGIGYNGLGTQFKSGIQSEASKGLSSNKTVNDHLIGAAKIGEYVHNQLKNSNYDIDWMVDTWVYEHLFLWATVKLTKKEHHKDNVLRNSNHTIEQKLNLEHYKNVSNLV
jgi:hypothetical protein